MLQPVYDQAEFYITRLGLRFKLEDSEGIVVGGARGHMRHTALELRQGVIQVVPRLRLLGLAITA